MTTSAWHYVADGKRRGPLDVGHLVAELCAFENPQEVLVWTAGLPQWVKAGEVEVLSRHLPPPVPVVSTSAAGRGSARSDAESLSALSPSDPESPPFADGEGEGRPATESAWYYLDCGQETGPIRQAVLIDAILSGRLPEEVLVWREGLTDWVKASDVRRSELPELQVPAEAGERTQPDAPGTATARTPRIVSPQEITTEAAASVAAHSRPAVHSGRRSSQREGPTGVGGWLLFVCVSLAIINPILLLVSLVDLLRVWPELPDRTMASVAVASLAALGIWSLVGGVQLWAGSPTGVRTTKWLLWSVPVGAIVLAILNALNPETYPVGDAYEQAVRRSLGLPYLPYRETPDYGAAYSALAVAFSATISAAIWTAYLNKSKRVANTYGLRRAETPTRDSSTPALRDPGGS